MREELADLEHQQWSHWTRYFLSNFDKLNVERWSAQIKIPYKMLSEKEKDADRIWADKVLVLFNQWKKEIKELKYDEVDDRFYGKYLRFKEQIDGSYCIINNNEELLGHLEKLRCGTWMHWCLLLEEGCYLSPGCNDEVREMQRKLGGKKNV